VLGSLVFALVSYLTTKETMLAYGWRIVFMTGVIPVFVALYIRNNLHESPEFEKTKALGKIEKSPFLSLFKPPQVWDFFQVFFFMTGLFLTDYSVYGFLPNILTLKGRGFDTTTYSLIYGFALSWHSSVTTSTDGSRTAPAEKSSRSGIALFSSCSESPSSTFSIMPPSRAIFGWPSLALSWQPCSSWPGESFPPISASVSPPAAAPPVSVLATPREPCWAHGSAPTYGGLTRSRLSLDRGAGLMAVASVVLTVGAIMTFISLYFSPETKDLQLDEVGEKERASDRAKEAAARQLRAS